MSFMSVVVCVVLSILVCWNKDTISNILNTHMKGTLTKTAKIQRDVRNGLVGKYEMGEYVTPERVLSFQVTTQNPMPPIHDAETILNDTSTSAICRVFRTNITEGEDTAIVYKHSWKVYVSSIGVSTIDTSLLMNKISNLY